MAGMYGTISGAEAFSEPRTSPVYNWNNFAPYFQPAAGAYRRFARRGGEADDLFGQYRDAYLGGSAEAEANARTYQDYTRGLFSSSSGSPAANMDQYRQVGDYLYGHFDKFRDASANAGLASMNSRLAGLGIRPGSTGYDRLLNATRITNNLAPVFANTTNAIGRDYSTLANNNYRDVALRLGLANDDALGGYMDRVYERPLDVAANRLGLINANNQTFANLSNAYKTNIAGYQTEETNDIARFGRPFDTWASSYGSYGSPGGAPPTGPQQPQMMPQGGYPTTNNPYTMPPAQNQAWMNEYYGGQPPVNTGSPYQGYLGDVNIGPATPYTA